MQPHAREAGCGDTAAIPGTDNDCVIDRHRFAGALCCKCHGRSIRVEKNWLAILKESFTPAEMDTGAEEFA